MGDVINLAAYVDGWKLLFEKDDGCSVLQVFVNVCSGDVEVVQVTDEGESIRSCLTPYDLGRLMSSINASSTKAPGP